ncbi:Serine carboxypeptidase S28 [Trichostrongylus colubriformis]|uniref:Serine carboxypeptidase S28 n=1 Tax=Trichostrongylus colubriformis TaxID=6319 RepID=A0AAN8IDD6_TRICO
MALLRFGSLLLLGFLLVAQCAPQKKFRRHMVRGRPEGGFVPKPVKNEKYAGERSYMAGIFENKVDHFSLNSTAVYNQRYWYNDQWYKSGGPVFLMLGGESEEDPYWVQDGDLEWTQMAQQNGAMVFLLEHRYYGQSRPTTDMATANLVYLSSAQALEDMAMFITAMKVKFPNIAAAPWVTFGGSYSGALAAWARIKHPELVAMAVGSSGPVQAENSITRESAQCAQSVTTAFNQVAALLQTASGRQSLKSTFNLCDDLVPTDAKQIENFWQTVYGPYMEIVQYSGDNACLNTLYVEKTTEVEKLDRFYIDECTNIFGSDYNSASVASAVAHVNDYYGGRNMDSSYIILPNGNIDPWHALGKLNSSTSTILPVVIDGAAHCADMYSPSSTDPASMAAARKTIATQLQQWLQSIN